MTQVDLNQQSSSTLAKWFGWFGPRFASTVLDDVWPAVLFFSSVATMVCVVTQFTSINLSVNSTGLTVLGTIVSLVVSFKTNSSYARWWEGRNIWSTVTATCRQLATVLWIQVPNIAPSSKEKDDKSSAAELRESLTSEGSKGTSSGGRRTDQRKNWEDLRGLVEKKTYIGLIQAYAVAVKHSLRGEHGPFYSDLYGLIAFLPKFNLSSERPITRDQLLVLWNNGLPPQQNTHGSESLAIPLTQSVLSQGAYHDHLPKGGNERGQSIRADEPERPLSTSSPAFHDQFISATTTLCSEGTCPIFLAARGPGEGYQRLPKLYPERRSGEAIHLSTVELMPPRHPPPTRIYDFFPPLRIIKRIKDWWLSVFRDVVHQDDRVKGGKRKRKGAFKSEIPQEILMYLSSYVATLISEGRLNSSLIGTTMTAINILHQALTDLDKIATTPIPSAYTFHLRLTVWAYLFFLPFQLYSYLNWVTIPATAIAATIYLGFLEIGNQIEEPFAYDQSDLDLDGYVLKITRQLAEVTAFPTDIPSSELILSPLNLPFLPTSSLSATDLLSSSQVTNHPTANGFAASFGADPDKNSGLKDEDTPRQTPKTMRDLELILNANWRQISEETDKLLARPVDLLERKTGQEVGVILL